MGFSQLSSCFRMNDIVKICKKHGELTLALAKPRPMKNKLSYKCLLCKRESSREEKKRNRERLLKQRRIYTLNKGKDLILKKRFNLTREDYNKILLVQNNKCAICYEPETVKSGKYGDVKSLSVDHCHSRELKGVTHVRGLLCSRCNRGLGYFRDNISLLKSAIQYLKLNG